MIGEIHLDHHRVNDAVHGEFIPLGDRIHPRRV